MTRPPLIRKIVASAFSTFAALLAVSTRRRRRWFNGIQGLSTFVHRYDGIISAGLYHETFGSGTPDDLTNFDAVAERERFIVAYPDAVEGSWNDGRAGRVTSIDDVDFTRALIDHIRGEFAIDTDRVYATGYSNGGHMVNRLAFETGETFAAVAPVASLLSVDLTVLVPGPMSKMPILLVHGTDDPLIPFTGGPTVLSRGRFSAVKTVDYWAQRGITDGKGRGDGRHRSGGRNDTPGRHAHSRARG
jgi:poly(3-hydroxybutyrate) depolymerase